MHPRRINLESEKLMKKRQDKTLLVVLATIIGPRAGRKGGNIDEVCFSKKYLENPTKEKKRHLKSAPR